MRHQGDLREKGSLWQFSDGRAGGRSRGIFSNRGRGLGISRHSRPVVWVVACQSTSEEDEMTLRKLTYSEEHNSGRRSCRAILLFFSRAIRTLVPSYSKERRIGVALIL